MKRKPITQTFLEAFQRPHQAVAIKYKLHKVWREMSWQDYFRSAEAVAQGLAHCGIKPGDTVAILSETRWEWAALDFGILGLGAITVPIYQSNRPEEIQIIIKDSEAKFLVVEDAAQVKKWLSIAKHCPTVKTVVCIDKLQDAVSGVMAWDEWLDQGVKAMQGQPDFFATQIGKNKMSDIATIVYTSGTTGEPKGAVLTHTQILSEVEAIGLAFPISSDDITLSFLPYAHVLGRIELWLHSYIGFTLAFAEGIDRLKQNLREVQPTVMIGVPRIFEKIYAGIAAELQRHQWLKSILDTMEHRSNFLGRTFLGWPRRQLTDRLIYSKIRQGLGGRLRFAVSGGAPLDAAIGKFFYRAKVLVLEGYGLTETTAAICANTPTQFEFGTVGRPMDEVEIKIAEDGEVIVKSDKVMREYYRNPKATQAVFKDGYFYTGDIGEWTKKGFLRITDRKKDLIKTAGGKYVAPQKLEGLFKTSPLISNVLIHGDRKKYIVALITLNEATAQKMAKDKGWSFRDYKALTQSSEIHEMVRKIVAQINSGLGSYETIKNFAILPQDFSIESGELTPSLKIKRKVCDERYKALIDSLY